MTVREGFDTTVKALGLSDVDAAAVALGEVLSDALDDAVNLEGEARTKALYLTPHLMNVLKELLATPAARKAVRPPAPSSSGEGADRGATLGKLRGIAGGKASQAR